MCIKMTLRFAKGDILTSSSHKPTLKNMRTTLTLDPDVAEQIRLAMKQRGKGLKTIVNEALRRGLCLERTEKAEAFQVEAHDFGMIPGIDLDRMNQLVDEIEVDHFSKSLKL